jgi:hypothetical protein
MSRLQACFAAWLRWRNFCAAVRALRIESVREDLHVYYLRTNYAFKIKHGIIQRTKNPQTTGEEIEELYKSGPSLLSRYNRLMRKDLEVGLRELAKELSTLDLLYADELRMLRKRHCKLRWLLLRKRVLQAQAIVKAAPKDLS